MPIGSKWREYVSEFDKRLRAHPEAKAEYKRMYAEHGIDTGRKRTEHEKRKYDEEYRHRMLKEFGPHWRQTLR